MSSSIVQRARVPLGFLYGILFLYLSRPAPHFFWPGVLVALCGVSLRLWASGYLNKGRELAMAGPYFWTRNPLYLGSFLIGAGFTLAGGVIWLMAVFPVLFFAIYLPVMYREERELITAFGQPYALYRNRVALFVPFSISSGTGPAWKDGVGNFLWARVIYNREYKAVIGFLVVTALIWGKMVWLQN